MGDDGRPLVTKTSLRYLQTLYNLGPAREAAGKGLPLIVMPHGGPSSRDEWGFDWLVQFFATRGFAVIQPNYRGSDGYGDSFEETGKGQIGRKMQDDLDDGMDWLVKQGTIARVGKKTYLKRVVERQEQS